MKYFLRFSAYLSSTFSVKLWLHITTFKQNFMVTVNFMPKIIDLITDFQVLLWLASIDSKDLRIISSHIFWKSRGYCQKLESCIVHATTLDFRSHKAWVFLVACTKIFHFASSKKLLQDNVSLRCSVPCETHPHLVSKLLGAI